MPKRFARVDKNLFRGGEPTADELAGMRKAHNLKKVVSLDKDVADRISDTCKKLGLEHIVFPLTDGRGVDANEIADEVRQWDSSIPTYVHCYLGKDRTGMMCAAYRVVMNGWGKAQALAEAHKFGMGSGMKHDIKLSYYEVVKNLPEDDRGDAADIVTQQRDDLAFEQHPPAINDQTKPYQNKSFAPYSDVEQDYLNRPGASHRIKELIKLAGRLEDMKAKYPELEAADRLSSSE